MQLIRDTADPRTIDETRAAYLDALEQREAAYARAAAWLAAGKPLLWAIWTERACQWAERVDHWGGVLDDCNVPRAVAA